MPLTTDEQERVVDEAMDWLHSFCEQRGVMPGGVLRAIAQRVNDGRYYE